VVGNSGSGKSTLGRALAGQIGAPFVELDAIFHQAGWTPLPTAEFRARVADLVTGDSWVIDGNYSSVRDLIWARADTVVWLDIPRQRVMWQLARRTLFRAIRRAELWNGNTEDWRNLISRDPNRNILSWAWTNHENYRNQYAGPHPDYPDIEVIRISDPSAAATVFSSIQPPD
jgi:adenylate kinase family enzyme